MPGNNRRMPRTLRNSIPAMISNFGNDIGNSFRSMPTPAPNLPALELPTAPKHFPFPNTPTDDDLFFETLMFAYTVLAAALQYLHLYRTVWWLPHSYTRHTMNFYLIDVNLILFIVIMLSRRLIYLIDVRLIERYVEPKKQKVVLVSHKYIFFVVTFGLLGLFAYLVMENLPVVNILYLSYPVLVYLILFGFEIPQFFELVSSNFSPFPPLHACRSTAIEVRDEVDNLKLNFNSRLKQILFSSVLNAYYAGFVPCCFAQNFLYYDLYWVSQHVFFIFISSLIAYAAHLLSLRYCDVLHRSALHLGTWDKLETKSILLVQNTWSAEVLWPQGALVKHGRDMYRAQGECNAGEPGNGTFARFYSYFKNPSAWLSIILTIHLMMILTQLILVVKNTIWYHLISLCFLLFFNYYTLYKLGRDYLISSRMYEEERAMHDKSNSN